MKLRWKIDESARKRWCAGVWQALTAKQLPPIPSFDITSRRDGLAAIKKDWDTHYDDLARYDRDLLSVSVIVSVERQNPAVEAVGILHRKAAFAFVGYSGEGGLSAAYGWPRKGPGHSSNGMPSDEPTFLRGLGKSGDEAVERAVLELNGELLFIEFGRYAADYTARNGRWDGAAQGFVAVNAPNRTLFSSDWVQAELDDDTQLGKTALDAKPADIEPMYACVFNLRGAKAKK